MQLPVRYSKLLLPSPRVIHRPIGLILIPDDPQRVVPSQQPSQENSCFICRYSFNPLKVQGSGFEPLVFMNPPADAPMQVPDTDLMPGSVILYQSTGGTSVKVGLALNVDAASKAVDILAFIFASELPVASRQILPGGHPPNEVFLTSEHQEVLSPDIVAVSNGIWKEEYPQHIAPSHPKSIQWNPFTLRFRFFVDKDTTKEAKTPSPIRKQPIRQAKVKRQQEFTPQDSEKALVREFQDKSPDEKKAATESYRVNDNVLMVSSTKTRPFVARIVEIDASTNQVLVQWYYRCQDLNKSTLQKLPVAAFPNEIFISEYTDLNPITKIIHKCHVASVARRMKHPASTSFVCRFQYDPTNSLTPFERLR